MIIEEEILYLILKNCQISQFNIDFKSKNLY